MKNRKNDPQGEKSPEKKESTGGAVLLAFFKFVPLFVFAILVILFKMDLLIAAPIATFVAAAVYMIVEREKRFEKAFDQGLKATRNIALIFFILMFAYGVAESFMATGVGASLILLALKLGITARTVAIVSMLVTCVLSIATGSSWGTFAACAPIFLWLNHLVGGDTMLTLCAIAGGSCFGDNIGMISDVTVLSCGMQDVKIIDRIKHQMVWCFSCLAIALVIFYLAGLHLPNNQGDVQQALSSIPQEAYGRLVGEDRQSAVLLLAQVKSGVPMYLIIPMILVIVLSFRGYHTLLCLGSGIVSALILGAIAGTCNALESLHTLLDPGLLDSIRAGLPATFTGFGQITALSDAAVQLSASNVASLGLGSYASYSGFFSWSANLLYSGFSGAGSWVIVMMIWVSAFGGIMNAMNAFAPLSRLVVKISRNVHQLMGWCGVLCLMGNMALADEAAQVATMSPIVRDIVETNVETDDEKSAYKLRLRLATFTSSMGIYGSQLIPWHCFPVFFASIATMVYPLQEFSPSDILVQNYMGWLIVGSALLLTFTGWDRFVPGFGLPKDARLKRQTKETVKAR